MALLGTGSPVLSEKRFENESAYAENDVMTVEGTIMRTFVLLFVVIAAACWPWTTFFKTFNPEDPASFNFDSMQMFLWGGIIGGLVLCLVICFKATMAPYLSVPYAFCEGLFLGAISAFFEAQYPGIVIQAAASTFAVLFVMLTLYRLRIIQATKKFRAVILSAIFAILLVYLSSMVLGLFGVNPSFFKQIYGSGLIGIGFSAFVCVIASLSLIMDFDMIERGALARAPKYMSWFGAFGLLVTLVWLYINILRLISKLRDR